MLGGPDVVAPRRGRRRLLVGSVVLLALAIATTAGAAVAVHRRTATAAARARPVPTAPVAEPGHRASIRLDGGGTYDVTVPAAMRLVTGGTPRPDVARLGGPAGVLVDVSGTPASSAMDALDSSAVADRTQDAESGLQISANLSHATVGQRRLAFWTEHTSARSALAGVVLMGADAVRVGYSAPTSSFHEGTAQRSLDAVLGSLPRLAVRYLPAGPSSQPSEPTATAPADPSTPPVQATVVSITGERYRFTGPAGLQVYSAPGQYYAMLSSYQQPPYLQVFVNGLDGGSRTQVDAEDTIRTFDDAHGVDHKSPVRQLIIAGHRVDSWTAQRPVGGVVRYRQDDAFVLGDSLVVVSFESEGDVPQELDRWHARIDSVVASVRQVG